MIVYSNIPGVCQYFCAPQTNYIPITGSPGPTGHDVGIAVPIGFNFVYQINSYNQAWICTNGFIVLGPSGTTSHTNDLSTTDPAALRLFTPFWDDLNTNNGGNIQYITQGQAPNRKFIVQFTNVAYTSGTGNVTFQIIFYETSYSVEVIYGPAVNNPSATGSVGDNISPGGTGNFVSITPGSNGCSNTTYSTTVSNNSVPYAFPSGTHYWLCSGEGISKNENTLPTDYSLSQNYPNPFNPETQIKYALPKAKQVKIVVCNILGAEVTTLVNEYKQAGNYNVTFNGSNLASGVYFYKITAGQFTDVKKMLLIK